LNSPLFELSKVSVAIGASTLLGDFDLSIDQGRATELIGHNGSGKLTLMRVLARHLSPDTGSFAFDGKPIDAWRPRGFAHRVTHLPQYTPPTNGMLVRELVALGRYLWHGNLGAFSDADRAGQRVPAPR
jgi:ferric hydroxamate transport system ATP-binding protein